ncbi:unnamed protein product [Spodoptera exigua]|nr:unnamed protein product [Spodoptera exigua]
MIMSSAILAIICGFLLKPASLSAIDYGPIKIIVRESPDALTDMIHQGENYYFKHHVNYPPSNFEAMMSLIQEDALKLEEETEKLQDILKPFIRPGSNLSKDRISKVEPLSRPSPLPVSLILEEEKPEGVILEQQPISVEPVLPQTSINDIPAVTGAINLEEPNDYKEKVILVEDTPALPLISIDKHPSVLEQVKLEEPKLSAINNEMLYFENYDPVIISKAPVKLPLLVSNYPVSVEEVKLEEPKEREDIKNTLYLNSAIIAEPPVFRPLSVNKYPVFVEKVKAAEPESYSVSTGASFEKKVKVVEPDISERNENTLYLNSAIIPRFPVVSSTSNNEYPTVSKQMKTEHQKVSEVVPPALRPMSVKDNSAVFLKLAKIEKPKVYEQNVVMVPQASVLQPDLTDKLVMVKDPNIRKDDVNTLHLSTTIPEAPVLPPSSINDYPVNFEQGNVEAEKPKVYEENIKVIPEAPVLLPNDNGVVEEQTVEEPKLNEIIENTLHLSSIIPEAPVLPPLSINEYPITTVQGKVESNVHRKNIQEVPVAPILPSLSSQDLPAVVKEQTIEDPKEYNNHDIVIPKAPVLPTVFVNDHPAVLDLEQVKVEKPKVHEENLKVIPEAPMMLPNDHGVVKESTVEEPKLNEIIENTLHLSSIIPEAPVLPPLSINEYPVTTVQGKVEPNVYRKNIQEVPVAPILPSLSSQDLPAVVKEQTIEDPKEYNNQDMVIPKAPVLPTVFVNDHPAVFDLKQAKVEKPKVHEENLKVIPEAPMLLPNDYGVVKESTVEEPKLNEIIENTLHLSSIIPEAPVLPPLSINEYPITTEQGKVEPNVYRKNIQEVPVAPILPSLSSQDLPAVAKEQTIENPKEYDNHDIVIPKAPVLPTVFVNDHPAGLERVKVEKPKEHGGNLDLIQGAPVLLLNHHGVVEESKVEEPKLNEKAENTLHLSSIIPEAPVLPPLSIKDYPITTEQGKIEPTVYKETILEIPEAPKLPALSSQDLPAVDKELTTEDPKEYKNNIAVVSEAAASIPVPDNGYAAVLEQKLPKVSDNSENVLYLSSGIIPEAPILPVVEKVKVEIPELSENMLYQSPVIMPEIPVLPPLSLNDYPATFEQVIVKKPNVYTENTEVTPVAPEMPSIVLNNNPAIVAEVNVVEPNETDEARNLLYLGPTIIPEAPVLPPLSEIDFPLAENIAMVPEAQHLSYDYPATFGELKTDDSKEYKNNVIVVPATPVLVDNIPEVVEEIKVEEPKLSEEIENMLYQSPVMIQGVSTLPLLSLGDYPTAFEQVKIEEPQVWSAAVFVLGTLLLKQAVPTSIDYEPIQITVNENFNSQSGPGDSLPARSGILHQGANFYFKPQINIPPAHIEALTSLVQRDRTPNRLIETEKIIAVMIPEAPILPSIAIEEILPVVEEVKLEESVVLEESAAMSPITEIEFIVPKGPLSAENKIMPIVEEVELIQPVLVEETEDVLCLNTEIGNFVPEAPTLPSIENSVPVVEDVEVLEPIILEEVVGILSPSTKIDNVIPEAPTLPPLSIEDNVPVIEDVKIMEPVILGEPIDVLSTSSSLGIVIPEAPTLPPLSIEDIVSVEEDVEVIEPAMLEETVDVILETPTLPPNEKFVAVCDKVELIEPVILEEPADMWSLVTEINEIILETSTLPPLTIEEIELVEPIIIDETVGVLSAITENTEFIAETPNSPTLVIENIVPFVEVNELEEPTIEETVGVLSGITEVEEIIPDAPTLPPMSIGEIDLFESYPKNDIIVPEPMILDEHVPVGEEVVIDPYINLKEPAYYVSNTQENLIIPGPPNDLFSDVSFALVECGNPEELVNLPDSKTITEPVLESDTAEYFIKERLPPLILDEVEEDLIMK